MAAQADILVVKLGLAAKNGFPRTTQLMEALDYVVRKAIDYGKPLVVNISFGNNYGDHTGSSLLENFINDIADSWKCSICIMRVYRNAQFTAGGSAASSKQQLHKACFGRGTAAGLSKREDQTATHVRKGTGHVTCASRQYE